MKLDRILPFARILLEKAVQPGDIAVDGTMGNGFDTVFLANLTGEAGHVYAFDIQSEAIQNTTAKLEAEQLSERCTLFHAGHEQLKDLIPEKETRSLTGAIFNLGYLPGGDKTITTKASTTISAIEQLLEKMKPEGIIVLVIYHGHPEGAIERDELLAYVKHLPQDKTHVLQYGFINQVNHPPFIVAIEKRV
ncbi:16S rRNA (cytosine(1402)-N(4))-methyltransferase [Peribacillus asahii]|uniref:16S rRNA (Cytosine(1402)-N(4))-methyltransferase n=1 Tax=Peribacillus asahii TaxID=228899 RepID=A0A398BFV1_9BACI|nr:class I SAM-dependent methyltransferase [Peribacillus asahii]RID86540.1 16S rRNA (cytosine(1402)-N(4))-methyltransferase [Peribacillus asahii]